METYLNWLSHSTPTKWWHDSAIPQEIDRAISNGALGVTTNPVLTYKALSADPGLWAERVARIPASVTPEERAEALLKLVATEAARKFDHIYVETDAQQGYALGQVNPDDAGCSDRMLSQALRFASWAPNIAVKVPTTRAALAVIEELSARGIAVCTTLNFSVAQAIAAAEAHERGVMRAKAAGVPVRPCFVVQQGARLDDYLTGCAQDAQQDIPIDTLLQAGIAVTKRVYQIFLEHGYSSTLMPAGLRGVHYLTQLAGGDLVFSLQTRMQRLVEQANPDRVTHMEEPVDPKVIDTLRIMPEFCRAYEPDGLKEYEFIRFGVVQRTLAQFAWTGWSPLETYGTSSGSSRWF